MLDILIQNGSIIDGTGKKAYIGDIGVLGGKITFHTDKESAAHIINASVKLSVLASLIFIPMATWCLVRISQNYAKFLKGSQQKSLVSAVLPCFL